MLDKAQARNRVILALISGFVVRVACKSFFGRFVLNELSKNGRFVSNSAKIWICGLYILIIGSNNVVEHLINIRTPYKSFPIKSDRFDFRVFDIPIN